MSEMSNKQEVTKQEGGKAKSSAVTNDSSSSSLTAMSSSSNTTTTQPFVDDDDDKNNKRSLDDDASSTISSPPPPTTTTTTTTNDNKRLRPAAAEKRNCCATDVELGLKAGDRLEVAWVVVSTSNNNNNNNNEVEEERWWGATLLDHDGRYTNDGVAIRVLQYDAYPEGGFPESSLEEVVFLNDYQLLNNYNTSTDDDDDQAAAEVMNYRKEGQEATVALDADDLRQELDTMLVGILQKHNAQWTNLDASKQAQIAELISNGKESIIASIQKRWEQNSEAISAAEIPTILENAFSHLTPKEE